jgi:hypothetical protein
MAKIEFRNGPSDNVSMVPGAVSCYLLQALDLKDSEAMAGTMQQWK